MTASRLNRNEARKRIAEWLADGAVSFSGHAREEMGKDAIETTDVENVLRCGRILEEAEEEHGSWRYRLHTAKFVVVVALLEEGRIIRVVTAWRKKERKS